MAVFLTGPRPRSRDADGNLLYLLAPSLCVSSVCSVREDDGGVRSHSHVCLNSGGAYDQVSVVLGPASCTTVGQRCASTVTAQSLSLLSTVGDLCGLSRTLPQGTQLFSSYQQCPSDVLAHIPQVWEMEMLCGDV